jgi:ATP-dependent helicase HrpA
VAKRIAEELNSPLGEVVGYKVRFQDRLQPGASVKLMTDGILLAETQTDPLLRAYDTLIIDEAHERSLNIDFLLGYLRQVLPRRPDLKVIVTSATIDAERFAQHFASRFGAGAGDPGVGPAVPGRAALAALRGGQRPRPRTTPSPMRWTSCGAGAGATSWSSCPASARSATPPTTCASTWHASARRPGRDPAAVRAPVAGRAGPVFVPGNGRRIVLATNVAETSLTVPGIRYVIDTGWRASSATASATRSSSCRSSRSARRRRTSAPGAAGAWPTASASASTTRTISPAGRASPTPRSCARRWPA